MISLEASLSQIPQEDYPKHSRVHAIPFLSDEKRNFFIKREDELGFFTSGSKIRKWRTLIPALIQERVETAILIGSCQSNNVLGLTLLLKEKGIKPLPILLLPYDHPPQGNRLFIELSLGETKPIYLKRAEWSNVDVIAKSLQEKLADEGVKAAIIPEGSYMEDAFYGALTLALDILQNEKDHGIHFDHIFIDAGTGLQAAALILGLGFLNHKARVSVLLLHEDKERFKNELARWEAVLQKKAGIKKKLTLNFHTFFPKGQRGFKPLEGKRLKNIVHFASQTGVWTDPLYSGRLIQEAPLEAQEEGMQGNVLLVHTGGLSSLFGFQDALNS